MFFFFFVYFTKHNFRLNEFYLAAEEQNFCYHKFRVDFPSLLPYMFHKTLVPEHVIF